MVRLILVVGCLYLVSSYGLDIVREYKIKTAIHAMQIDKESTK